VSASSDPSAEPPSDADRCHSHCPWVDNCIGVNNHKHFVLYVMFLIAGIGLLIRLTIACESIVSHYPGTYSGLIKSFHHLDIEILPEPTEFHCSILKDALCAQFSKDPLTIITNAWGSLQLTWTFMLLFVHLSQIARNITTYETMRGQVHAGPLMTAVATGTISAEGAQVDGQEATTDANHEDGSAGPLHGHGHKRKAKEGCLTQWSRLLGIDTFVTIAFQGYKGSQSQAERKRQKKRNLWTRGMVRNCQDFWLDGPVMKRRAESTKALLGGEEVDYAFVYDVPKRSGMSYRGGYESVATEECEV